MGVVTRSERPGAVGLVIGALSAGLDGGACRTGALSEGPGCVGAGAGGVSGCGGAAGAGGGSGVGGGSGAGGGAGSGSGALAGSGAFAGSGGA